MKNILFILTILSFLPVLGGCTNTQTAHKEPLTPYLIADDKTPDNDVLMSAVKEYIKIKAGPANSRYEFTRTDLNNDGKQDALVLLKTPYTHWCGLTGCRMLVLEAKNGAFSLLSEVEMVRGPLLVTEDTTAGWKDIVLRFDGVGSRAQHIALTHNGQSYPSNPLSRYAYFSEKDLPQGTTVFP